MVMLAEGEVARVGVVARRAARRRGVVRAWEYIGGGGIERLGGFAVGFEIGGNGLGVVVVFYV